MKLADLKTFTKHPSCLLADKVMEICAPLFASFPINYFCYTRWHENCGLFLSSNKSWLRYYVKSNFPFLINGKKIHSWSTDMPSLALTEAISKFNFHNGIIMEKPSFDHIETLEFASPHKHADTLEFCANKDLLNQFLLYFKDKAEPLIKTVEKEPICFPQERFLAKSASCFDDFYCSIKHKKISFKFKNKDIFLSRREYDVLCLLAKGKNMAEIAEILQISRRTVETYLYDAKNKAGAHTVNQLLEEFANALF